MQRATPQPYGEEDMEVAGKVVWGRGCLFTVIDGFSLALVRTSGVIL